MPPTATTDRNSQPRVLEQSEIDAVVGGAAPENIVFTSVSNVLKTRHDTVKNSIGN